MNPDREVAVLVDPAVGFDDGRRQPVAFVDAGGAGGAVGRGAETAAGDAILEGDAGCAAEQGVLDHRRIGAVEEDARRVAVVVGQDLDVVGRLGVAGYPSAPQRGRIGDADERPVHPPAPRHADIDRMIGCHPVEIVARREPALVELVGPADIAELGRSHRHADDPFAGRRARRRAADGLGDGGDRMPAGERVAAARFETFAVHVGVRIEQAGTRGRSREVDHPGRAAPPGEHLGRRTDRRDSSRRDGDRLDVARRPVESDHAAVVQDQIVLRHRAPRSNSLR